MVIIMVMVRGRDVAYLEGESAEICKNEVAAFAI